MHGIRADLETPLSAQHQQLLKASPTSDFVTVTVTVTVTTEVDVRAVPN